MDYENGVHSPLEPIFSEDSTQWGVEMSLDFLDASRSHKFFRAFYVPFTRSVNLRITTYLVSSIFKWAKKNSISALESKKWSNEKDKSKILC